MSIKRVVGWSLAVLGVAILGVIAFCMISAYIVFYVPGDADVACSRDKDGRLVIDLRPNWRVRWVNGIFIWSEGGSDFLWAIRDIGRPERRAIVYGELPPGSFQVIPKKGLPPGVIPDEGVFYVGVDVGWDGPFPVSADIVAKFRAHTDGTIEYLGKSDLNQGVDINFPTEPSNTITGKSSPE